MNVGRMHASGPEGPKVVFELLKRWVSNTFLREAPDTSPAGCPWQSFALALEESRRRRWREARSEGVSAELESVTEADLRLALVNAYKEMPVPVRREVAEAKLEDDFSIFALALFPDVETVLQHWKWYLYSLTFESREFTSDGVHWDKFPDIDEPSITRIPLDLIDLQILARIFKVQITVSRLGAPALRVYPAEADGCNDVIHLLMHGGLWAPLLGPRASPVMDVECVGAVVELGDDLHCFEEFAGHAAHVLAYDEVQDFYTACVGRHIIPVQRERIRRILACEASNSFRARPTKVEERRKETRSLMAGVYGPGPGDAPSLLGVPDGSLEFQLLWDLVKKLARDRLSATMAVLEGKVPAERDPFSRFSPKAELLWHLGSLDRLSPLPEDPEVKPAKLVQPYVLRTRPLSAEPEMAQEGRRPLEDVVQMLVTESASVWIRCPSTFRPTPAQRESLLSCEAGDFIRLTSLGRRYPDGSLNLLADPGHSAKQKWILSDTICQFLAKEDFVPEKSWSCLEAFLPLTKGDLVVLTGRESGAWEGWARGKLWPHRPGQRDGLFPLAYLQPQLFVKSCCPTNSKTV